MNPQVRYGPRESGTLLIQCRLHKTKTHKHTVLEEQSSLCLCGVTLNTSRPGPGDRIVWYRTWCHASSDLTQGSKGGEWSDCGSIAHKRRLESSQLSAPSVCQRAIDFLHRSLHGIHCDLLNTQLSAPSVCQRAIDFLLVCRLE